MKRTFVKIVNGFVFAAVISIALLAGTEASASVHSRTIEIIADSSQASVEYIHTVDNAQFFRLKIADVQTGKFILTISRENGDILYTKQYVGTSFDRVIKMLPDENDNQNNYTFNISRGNKYPEENFTINTTTKSVDTITITKEK